MFLSVLCFKLGVVSLVLWVVCLLISSVFTEEGKRSEFKSLTIQKTLGAGLSSVVREKAAQGIALFLVSGIGLLVISLILSIFLFDWSTSCGGG